MSAVTQTDPPRVELEGFGTNPSLEFTLGGKVKLRCSEGLNFVAEYSIQGDTVTLVFDRGMFKELKIQGDNLTYERWPAFIKQ